MRRSRYQHLSITGENVPAYPSNVPCGFYDYYSDHLTTRTLLVTCPTCLNFMSYHGYRAP